MAHTWCMVFASDRFIPSMSVFMSVLRSFVEEDPTLLHCRFPSLSLVRGHAHSSISEAIFR